jgi:hypothetical protein
MRGPIPAGEISGFYSRDSDFRCGRPDEFHALLFRQPFAGAKIFMTLAGLPEGFFTLLFVVEFL